MKPIYLLILTFLLSLTLKAQINPKTKWGDVSQAEIDLKQVPFEKDAAAVILYETGDVVVNYNMYEKKIYKRIKILDQSAIDLANQQFTYYSERGLESIKGIKAQTINFENGTKTINEVDKKSIFEVDVNQYYKAYKFTFPNVKVGSIIEFQYEMVDQKIMFINAWEFQHEIPTLYSKFSLNNASYIDFKGISIGEKLVKLTKNKTQRNEWILTEIPSYKSLNHVYNKEDVAERLVFQIQGYLANSSQMDQPTQYVTGIGSWSKLIKDADKDYTYMSNPSAVKNLPFPKNGKDEVEHLNQIINYFKSNFKWNNFTSIYPKLNNREVIDSRNGNMADLNLLLNTILKEAGYDSKLVLISSRKNGKIITSYPYIGQFDGLINLVTLKNGSTFYLDASYLDSGLGYIPLRSNNYLGLIIDTKAENFTSFELPLSEFHSTQNYALVNGKFIGTKVDKANGYFNTEANEVIKGIGNSFNIEFKEKSKTPPSLLDNKYLGTKTILESDTELQPFYMIENPLIKILSQYNFDEKERERALEFDFPFYYKITTTFKIPDGYKVEIPQNLNTKNEIGKNELIYYQNAEIKDNTLLYSIEFLLNKSIISNKYQEVKRFFDNSKLSSSQNILIKRL